MFSCSVIFRLHVGFSAEALCCCCGEFQESFRGDDLHSTLGSCEEMFTFISDIFPTKDIIRKDAIFLRMINCSCQIALLTRLYRIRIQINTIAM